MRERPVGQYRAMPRGLVSGYTARANIRMYYGRDNTEGRDLTEWAKWWIVGQILGFFGK